MISRKMLACTLACILGLSIIPALSECGKCSGIGCISSQFSLECKYNCECHSSRECNADNLQTQKPIIDSETEIVIPDTNNNDSLSAEIIRQVNAERAKYGLGALKMDAELTHAAYIRAREIVEKFSHTRPDGSSWGTVSPQAKGENIARGYNTADKVMAAWLTSEGHRANILRSGFGSIGVCAIEHNGIMYWVQLFGS